MFESVLLSDDFVDGFWCVYALGIVIFAFCMEDIVKWELKGQRKKPAIEVLLFIFVSTFWLLYLIFCLYRWCRDNWYSYG